MNKTKFLEHVTCCQKQIYLQQINNLMMLHKRICTGLQKHYGN